MEALNTEVKATRKNVNVVEKTTASTKEGLRLHKNSTEKFLQQKSRNFENLETEMVARIGRIETKLIQKYDPVLAKTKDLTLLQKILNRKHLSVQRRDEMQTEIQSLQTSVKDLRQKTSNNKEDLKDVKLRGKPLEKRWQKTEKNVKDGIKQIKGDMTSTYGQVIQRIKELETKTYTQTIHFDSMMDIPDKPESYSFLTKTKTVFGNKGGQWDRNEGCLVIPKNGRYMFTVEVYQTGEGAVQVGLQPFKKEKAESAWCALTMTIRHDDVSTAATVVDCFKRQKFGVAIGLMEGKAKPFYCMVTSTCLD